MKVILSRVAAGGGDGLPPGGVEVWVLEHGELARLQLAALAATHQLLLGAHHSTLTVTGQL